MGFDTSMIPVHVYSIPCRHNNLEAFQIAYDHCVMLIIGLKGQKPDNGYQSELCSAVHYVEIDMISIIIVQAGLSQAYDKQQCGIVRKASALPSSQHAVAEVVLLQQVTASGVLKHYSCARTCA